MEAHIESETIYSLSNFDRGAMRHLLTHIIIPDECLSAAGIDLTNLKDASPRYTTSVYSSLSVSVGVQIRQNATGLCSNWSNVYGEYVPSGALHSLLVPQVTNPAVFSTSNQSDQGALFISLPIECDSQNRFDPFTSVALRIPCSDLRTGDYKSYKDILFTQDELVPIGTRYNNDTERLQTLFLQFLQYTKKFESELPVTIIELGAKLEACIGNVDDVIHSQSKQFDIMHLLANNKHEFDTPDIAARIEADNTEIVQLIKKAAEAITKRAPVSGSLEKGSLGVVSGLKQGAIACLKNNTDLPSKNTQQKAVMNGLEPAGKIRFVGDGNTNVRLSSAMNHQLKEITTNFEDVLMFDSPSQKPVDSKEIFLTAIGILGNGITLANLWRCGSISIVTRVHPTTKSQFYIVAYENSVALGGRSSHLTPNPTSLNILLSIACQEEGVDHPCYLSQERKIDTARQAPILSDPLLREHNQLQAFSAGSEIDLMIDFKTHISNCVISAIGEALRMEPNLYQMISYHIHAYDLPFITEITNRTPNYIRATLNAISNSSWEKFSTGALISAAISYMAGYINKFGGKAYRRYTTENAAEHLGGDYQLVNTKIPGLVLFDYYSTGGECIKLNNRPVPIILNGGVDLWNRQPYNRSVMTCTFPEWFVPHATCEKFLPGESYAYICVGYDEHLHIAIVLPAGFMLTAHTEFNWPVARIEAVLSRLCRTNKMQQVLRPYVSEVYM